MLKIVFLCRRRPEITHEQYAEFVLEGHAPLALKHHPTLLRYVINVVESNPPGAPELDSLPALYFASLDRRANLARVPVGPGGTAPAGDVQLLTDAAARDEWPSVSADGKTVVFLSDRRSSRGGLGTAGCGSESNGTKCRRMRRCPPRRRTC